MAKGDKDRYQKELSVRLCLARGWMPFLEVAVRSATDLSDTVEELTDLDVVGFQASGDRIWRVILDCKSSGKMSPVNRSFWAAGVKQYTHCDEAYVLLKNAAVHNHKLTALELGVNLHDEASFIDLGRTFDPAFPSPTAYQAIIQNWDALRRAYVSNPWTESLFDLVKNQTPITRRPATVFRRLIAEFKSTRGEWDPEKVTHKAVFLDALASIFALWSVIGRDVRRFYEPGMEKQDFEKTLRYYLWDGKESYLIRQQLGERSVPPSSVDLPAWPTLLSFAGLVVSAPHEIMGCAFACRELSFKLVSPNDDDFDNRITEAIKRNTRIRQFVVSLSEYVIAASGISRDMNKQVQELLYKF